MIACGPRYEQFSTVISITSKSSTIVYNSIYPIHCQLNSSSFSLFSSDTRGNLSHNLYILFFQNFKIPVGVGIITAYTSYQRIHSGFFYVFVCTNECIVFSKYLKFEEDGFRKAKLFSFRDSCILPLEIIRI